MRMKARPKTPVRTPRQAGFKKLVRFTRTMSTRMMFISVFGVLGVAVLIGAATSDGRSDNGVAQSATRKPLASPATAAALAVPSAVPPAIVARAADVEADVKDRAQRPSPVTITGCLEREADSFRLKDTAGENAPKARSWKSGFLKKGSAAIHVVDTANRTKLPSHVGQRVSVTGTLVDREMQVRSLQRVAASCADKS